MENFRVLIREIAETVVSLMGCDPRQEENESLFFESLQFVMNAAIPRRRPYRASMLYHVLVFFFGHTTAHVILMRYQEFLSARRNLRSG